MDEQMHQRLRTGGLSNRAAILVAELAEKVDQLTERIEQLEHNSDRADSELR